MCPDLTAAGSPIDAGYARTWARFEPLIEMMQVKGNSAVHRAFSGGDAFAGFGNADSIQQFAGRTLRRSDFVRAGVIQGMAVQQRLGVNPFKLGFAGGTDGTVALRRTATVEG
jgi:hypothetical protein